MSEPNLCPLRSCFPARLRSATSLPVAVALVGLVLTIPASAAADWLVTQDGHRVETRGPWEVQGRLLVFTRTNGTLSSMRISEVDLAASAAATRESKEPVPPTARAPQAPAAPAPVLVLTDDDVASYGSSKRRRAPAPRRPAAVPAAPDREPETAKEATDKTAGERVVVDDWRDATAPDALGVVLLGRISNPSRDVAGAIRLTATLYDSQDEMLETSEAVLSSATLRPGERTNFRVNFSSGLTFSRVEFEVESLGLKTAGE